MRLLFPLIHGFISAGCCVLPNHYARARTNIPSLSKILAGVWVSS